MRDTRDTGGAEVAGKVPLIYSDAYYVEIGDHVFPTSKYRLLKERIDRAENLRRRVEYLLPHTAQDEEILTVHTPEYLRKLKNCELSYEEILTLEMPISRQLVEAAFICCGGTLLAAREALAKGAAVHLGGGFHHAFPEHGEGFCVLNDVAISVRVLQKQGLIERAAVIDCDLHQGNGTASVFGEDERVFTFSIHQENNYPFYKPPGDMDIGLRDYVRDREYLAHLFKHVPRILDRFKPELIFYLAGADPYEHDQLGRLAVTKQGLRERDRFVYTQARNFSVPIAIVLAGGYAYDRRDTVDIHFATVEECVEVFAC